MATQTRLLTAEEFLTHPSSRSSELIDGVVVEMSLPAGGHGKVQSIVIRLLGPVEDEGLGEVVGELGCILSRNPDVVRAPDVAFIRSERIPATGIPTHLFWIGAPDLVVEIVSRGDRAGEILTKTREWIQAGARQVWVLYQDTRTVEVIRSLHERITFTTDEIVDAGDAVPGFSCRVSQLFPRR